MERFYNLLIFNVLVRINFELIVESDPNLFPNLF